MELTGAIQDFKTAQTQTTIQNAVAAKVMKTTAALQADLVSQLLGAEGIGRNLNIVA